MTNSERLKYIQKRRNEWEAHKEMGNLSPVQWYPSSDLAFLLDMVELLKQRTRDCLLEISKHYPNEFEGNPFSEDIDEILEMSDGL